MQQLGHSSSSRNAGGWCLSSLDSEIGAVERRRAETTAVRRSQTPQLNKQTDDVDEPSRKFGGKITTSRDVGNPVCLTRISRE